MRRKESLGKNVDIEIRYWTALKNEINQQNALTLKALSADKMDLVSGNLLDSNPMVRASHE